SGLFFANAISSATVLGGNDVCATSAIGCATTMLTPAKSLIGSNGRLRFSAAFMTWKYVASSSVWPSGCARASAEVATMVLAPGRFSTMTGLPQRAESWSARMRMMTSAGPPGGNGTIPLTGPVGKSDAGCAGAGHDATTATASAATRPTIRFMFITRPASHASLRLEVRRPGDLRPLVDLGAEPGVEFLRGHAHRVDAEVLGPLGEPGRREDGGDVGRKLVDDSLRHAGRCDHRVERDDVEARVGLRDGRHLRGARQPLGPGAGDQLQLAGVDIAFGRMPDVEHQRHPAGDHVGQ